MLCLVLLGKCTKAGMTLVAGTARKLTHQPSGLRGTRLCLAYPSETGVAMWLSGLTQDGTTAPVFRIAPTPVKFPATPKHHSVGRILRACEQRLLTFPCLIFRVSYDMSR